MHRGIGIMAKFWLLSALLLAFHPFSFAHTQPIAAGESPDQTLSPATTAPRSAPAEIDPGAEREESDPDMAPLARPKKAKLKQPVPLVKERILSVNGALATAEAEKILLHNLESLKQEYMKVLAQKAELTGTLTLEVTLDALGVVTQVTLLQDQLVWQALSDKVVEIMKGWVFTAPTDGKPVKIKCEIRFDLK